LKIGSFIDAGLELQIGNGDQQAGLAGFFTRQKLFDDGMLTSISPHRAGTRCRPDMAPNHNAE
jgi:hypothetical protein